MPEPACGVGKQKKILALTKNFTYLAPSIYLGLYIVLHFKNLK